MRRGRGLRFVGPACSDDGHTPGDTTRKRNSDEDYARPIDALRMRARCSRRWTGMPYNRKHDRATCLLRCSDSSENSKAGSYRKRRVAAALQRPLHRGRRPNHRQAKGYLPRLLKIDAFRPCPGVAAGPLSRDRRGSGASSCPCRNEPGSPCRTRFGVARIYRSATGRASVR